MQAKYTRSWEVRVQLRSIMVQLSKSHRTEAPTEADLREEFEVYGKIEMLGIIGTTATLTYADEASVDAILLYCSKRKNEDVDNDESIPPKIWLRYRAEDQAKYRIKIAVARPREILESSFAYYFDIEKRWKLYDEFIQFLSIKNTKNNSSSPHNTDRSSLVMEVSFTEFKSLVKDLSKQDNFRNKHISRAVKESLLAEVFNTHSNTNSTMDFYSFLEAFGQICRGELAALKSPSEKTTKRSSLMSNIFTSSPLSPTPLPSSSPSSSEIQIKSLEEKSIDISKSDTYTEISTQPLLPTLNPISNEEGQIRPAATVTFGLISNALKEKVEARYKREEVEHDRMSKITFVDEEELIHTSPYFMTTELFHNLELPKEEVLVHRKQTCVVVNHPRSQTKSLNDDLRLKRRPLTTKCLRCNHIQGYLTTGNNAYLELLQGCI